MGSGSKKRQRSSTEVSGLSEWGAVQDNLHSNTDGSNAVVLPGRKKSKSKGKGKDDKKYMSKEGPKISKSKLKNLQKLEEEKQKKLLQAKSIELLRKHKIWDGAYSLLQSSGTIGQAETMQEKRRRSVQFAKAGLEIPKEFSPFKMKSDHKDSENSQAVLKSCQEKSVTPAKSEDSNGDDSNHVETGSMVPMESKPLMDIELNMPEQRAEESKDGTDIVENQEIPSNIRSSSSTMRHTDLQGEEVGLKLGSQVEEAAVDVEVKPSIVVPVSRPPEVEKTRRDLPIIMMEQEIMEAINENSVVILCGETGCGKTTQVPQFLYEAGFGSSDRSDRKGIIGVTQPRRVAVLATAKRVSYELGLSLGKEVGFQVRHDKMIGNRCSIKFMTDGILLREVQSDFLLKRYSVIILDEAHERSLNTDILIGMLSRIIKIRQMLHAEQQEKMRSGLNINPENMISQLKVVLMSATLRVSDFVSNRKLFDATPPVVEVPVRQFPVTVHFSKRTHDDYLRQAYKKVVSIHKKLPPGGILVFVTGQREVDFLCKKLRGVSRHSTEKKPAKNGGDEIGSTSEINRSTQEVDAKEISEAYDVDNYEHEHQNDIFSSYNEGEGDKNPGLNFDSSDIETESDMETDSEDEESITYEAPERDGPVLDFLKDTENLSLLKASFEAISGKSGEAKNVEKLSEPGSAEKLNPSVPCVNKCAGSTVRLHVLPLYAMLQASQQLQVFQDVPEGERLVVVATNVAETSLTIPGIKYVVDTGKVKVKNYNCTTGMAAYEVQWISKASAAQRAGRAGRTGPGHCYRLYSSAAYSKDDLFPEFSFPEILKIPVDGVVLMMKFMAIDKVANFPFPTPPEKQALVEAERCLKTLEALDSQGRLTPMGKAMAQYPMSPRHSRLLLTMIKIMKNQQGYARSNFILGYAAAAASALSFTNPFHMQSGESNDRDSELKHEGKSDAGEFQEPHEKKRQKKLKTMVREAQAKFSNPSSDALTIARALQLFELAQNQLEFCRVHQLHLKTMEEMSKLRMQLLQLIFHNGKFCEEFAWNDGSIEDVEQSWRSHSDKKPLQMNEEELLGQAICAGWVDRVAKRVRIFSESSKDDQKIRAVHYQSCALSDTIYLHRSSSVAQTAPEFVVYSELLHTKRPYMHGVTSVKPRWLLKYASSLCTFSAPLEDPKPYYDPLSDQVYCYVSPIFTRHNWQLPLHSIPIKEATNRLQVFACALLKGDVLPCLRAVQKFLAVPPSVALGPISHRRVGDLLNRMKIGSKLIDSRATLGGVWNDNPSFLYPEICNWFQDKFHHHFREIWEQMHREVLLEGHELYPKRVKKVKK